MDTLRLSCSKAVERIKDGLEDKDGQSASRVWIIFLAKSLQMPSTNVVLQRHSYCSSYATISLLLSRQMSENLNID
jgi:hypothetical protein